MSKILVTGAEGFIGKHLAKALEEARHEVVCTDLPRDLTVPGAMERLLGLYEPDAVVHLAAQVGRIFGERDLCHTVNSNALLTTLVAHQCGKRDIPVLYSSSSEAYGDQGEHECAEDDPCKLPHNLYGLTKRWGEEALQLYAPDNLKIVRLSMPYGVGAPPGVGRRAMDTFLWQAHHRMPITVHRGAERSWCHVSDTVRGIVAVLDLGAPGVYNIGRSDRPVAMETLAKMCCKLTGAPCDLIQLVDPPKAQTVVKRLSMAKMNSLGWRPRVELDEGLRELLHWVARFGKDGAYA